MNSMERAVIVDALRTPIGRYAGGLKDVRPDDLAALVERRRQNQDRKSTRLNSSHRCISYAVFCLKKKIEGSNAARDVRDLIRGHFDLSFDFDRWYLSRTCGGRCQGELCCNEVGVAQA